jgi:hypothetical protein
MFQKYEEVPKISKTLLHPLFLDPQATPNVVDHKAISSRSCMRMRI